MIRTHIETLLRRRIEIRLATPEDYISDDIQVNDGDVLILEYNTGKVLASVSRDDLFDAFGNRFTFGDL